MSEEFGPGQLSTSAPVRYAHPPFAMFLYGGVVQEDEHVTVWEPKSGKTVAGNAAPYRKNLRGWLLQHPGWEEKADELKTSKRRSAARKQKAVASAFAAMCAHAGDIVHALSNEVAGWLEATGASSASEGDGEWSQDDEIRLKEALVQRGEQLYFSGGKLTNDSQLQWKGICAAFVPRRAAADVLRKSRDLLEQGLLSYSNDGRMYRSASGYGSPVDATGHPTASPLSSSLSFLERQLLPPREPRITVWDPATGRTVSGNAAPCRRNLDTWIRAHPGWEPKTEDQLSSSRRVKSKRDGSVGFSALSTSTPQLTDALDALMLLGQSPTVGSAPPSAVDRKVETASTSSDMDIDNGDFEEIDEELEEQNTHRPMIRSSAPMSIPD
mmetsp:Transcript_23258/g.92679  ORF Transcript_23258/g.92679 Transcript_23258/m.92679 type:complete len:383 (-) Transcript_23258:171-1319(-)|eukprot:CAMPEP_0113969740 /NCGR_PEP_ID=MMETSP0011_2-20120614/10559_1 /TAXON_ID=101924 /ORGANISM="Rhodosorus marinus" /LENGTH=382 /DNA_ID=CAMNT_0000983579 /DNA_START=193 /DNA_END=1341 /DNA_ORIENTATION=- /assembly_acc=CAM_ASM_000156